MTRIKFLSFLIVLAFFALNSIVSAKMKIGVVEFEERNAIGLDGATKIIPEMLSENLVNVGIYEVTERLLLIKVLQEQELGMTGIIDTKSAPEVGKLYGLEGLVTGSYMKVGDEITINARLINTTTGQIMTASTVKFNDIKNLQAQLEIAANELSGISREKLKVKKEDIQKERFRAGVYAGIAYGNDSTSKYAINLPLGFFITSKYFYFDFIGSPPILPTGQITVVMFAPGVNINRYFGIGAGYIIMNANPAYGDANKADILPDGQTDIHAEFKGFYLDFRIRPSYKFIINLYIGGNLGTIITMRKGESGGNSWYEFRDTRMFADFPPSPFGISLDYFLTAHWGIKAYLLMMSGEGTQTEGTPLAYNLQSYRASSIGLAASYSFSFGNK